MAPSPDEETDHRFPKFQLRQLHSNEEGNPSSPNLMSIESGPTPARQPLMAAGTFRWLSKSVVRIWHFEGKSCSCLLVVQPANSPYRFWHRSNPKVAETGPIY